MLEDIKNVMNSKRLNNDSKVSRAFIQDTKTGELYEVNTDKNFLFGRFLKSSIVIEELYISRSHSTIRYENDQFLLEDNNSCTGTYLNYKKISNEVVLQNGDLIAFTDKNKIWDFVYKFCLVSNPKKKLKLGENVATENNDKFKVSIEHLQNKVKELKDNRTNILNDVKSQIDGLKKLIDNATEFNIKINKEMSKHQDINKELNKELTIYKRKCVLQKELLDTKTAKEESVETFKAQIIKLLESDFQCAICNEVMFRASTTNCNHTFCESCLKKWLTRSNCCPTCRGAVHSITNCLTLDNYITSLCDLLGGTIKEQRLALQTERNGHPPQVAKRGRKRANPSNRGRREPTYNIPLGDPAINNRGITSRFLNAGPHGFIEIVDLTNNTSR